MNEDIKVVLAEVKYDFLSLDEALEKIKEILERYKSESHERIN